MKLHYKGKFDGDVNSIPHGEHKPGAVKFREPEDPKKLGLIANGIAVGIVIAAVAGVILRAGERSFSIAGVFLSYITVFPHEILHGICFKDEVYLYTNLKDGMLFVTGPEDMSKVHYLMEYAGKPGQSVSDPWYTRDFKTCYNDIFEGCNALLEYIKKNNL